MHPTEEEINEQLQANVPEVRPGQVWGRSNVVDGAHYPSRVRVICRYPFSQPEDGRLWIVESYTGSLGRIYRIPELSLRVLYDLAEEAPAA